MTGSDITQPTDRALAMAYRWGQGVRQGQLKRAQRGEAAPLLDSMTQELDAIKAQAKRRGVDLAGVKLNGPVRSDGRLPEVGATGVTPDRADVGPNVFIEAPDGGVDFGEITPEMGKVMRRQAGKIRLQQGVQNSDGTGWGMAHIEANHGKEIRSAGFDSVQSFVARALRQIDAIWKPRTTAQLIAVQSGSKGKAVFLELQPAHDAGGDFYRVNSAFPASDNYVARKDRLALYRSTEPHKGFRILRRWSGQMPAGTFIMTSNVDGQFQKAGFSRDLIWECHGSIHELQCTKPCRDDTWSATRFEPDVDVEHCRLRNLPPRCRCGAVARPNVLMFGDPAWSSGPSDCQQEGLEEWLAEAGRIVVIEIGAGTDVPSVRRFSERMVIRRGAGLVRINPVAAEVPGGEQVGVQMGALQALQAIDAIVLGGMR